jgi:thiamine biosynthesis lipoprotein
VKPYPTHPLGILRRLQPVKNLLLFALFTVAAHGTEVHPHKQIRYIMGTTCEITAYSAPGESEKTDAAINAAFDELKRIDALLSNWNSGSDLMRMNSAAARTTEDGTRPQVPVSTELFERIQMALRIAQDTDGRFDPTVGPLVRAWGFLPSTPTTNRDQAIAQARTRVGWEKVKLDLTQHTIQFAVPGMEVDLGGIAKGYAAQRAAQVLRDHGIQSALVSLGTSSITALGSPPDAPGWPILIRDPRDGQTPAAWLELHDGESLATSGTYENTVGKGHSRRSHIIDPQSGQAVGGAVGVTILLDDAEIADALTKPFFLTPPNSPQNWPKWLARFPKASIILMDAQSRELKPIAGGASPDRFRIPPSRSKREHVAETYRRPAHDLARNDARGPRDSSQPP